MKRNITPLLFGIVFILAGVGYLGSAFWGWDFSIFFAGWWTLFIIVPCFISILANGPHGFNICGLLIGVILFLNQQQFLTGPQTRICIVAAVILSIGVAMIIKYIQGPKPVNYNYGYNPPPTGYNTTAGASCQTPEDTARQAAQGGGYYDSSPSPNYNAILSGLDVKNNAPSLETAKVSAILGGADVDLRGAVVSHDITVYLTSVLGGITLYAPFNIRINISKTSVLGGTTCTAPAMPPDSGAPTVTFICNAVLGGIEIK